MEINCETHISAQQTGAQTPPRLQNPHGDRKWQKDSCQPPFKGSRAPIGIGNPMCAALLVLKDSADFQRLSRHGKRWTFPSFIMQALKRDDVSGTSSFRLGLTVSRKIGNAVKRNRAKRRLREMVRLYPTPEKLVGWDIVLIARPSSSERDFSLMRQDFVQGLKNIGVEG
jgi:ribonuclease P protein component